MLRAPQPTSAEKNAASDDAYQPALFLHPPPPSPPPRNLDNDLLILKRPTHHRIFPYRPQIATTTTNAAPHAQFPPRLDLDFTQPEVMTITFFQYLKFLPHTFHAFFASYRPPANCTRTINHNYAYRKLLATIRSAINVRFFWSLWRSLKVRKIATRKLRHPRCSEKSGLEI